MSNKDLDLSNPNCSVYDVMNIIGGKWKIDIIYHLGEGTLRFGELKKSLVPITQQMPHCGGDQTSKQRHALIVRAPTHPTPIEWQWGRRWWDFNNPSAGKKRCVLLQHFNKN